jgi:NTP pyrophosphatase (non-canonical NTP hydrolase)
MTFNEYQQQAITTALPHPDPLMYKTIMAMGIAGEAGEVLEKWKKIVAYKEGVITSEDKKEFQKELADVVWYIAVLADALDIKFDTIMEENLVKLADRKKRGVQKGRGDNR